MSSKSVPAALSAIFCFIIFLVFICQHSLAQNHTQLDSLRHVFKSASSDSLQIQILLKQYDILVYENPEEAHQVVTKAIELSRKGMHQKFLVRSYNCLADLHFQQGDYDGSIHQYEASLSQAERLKYAAGMSAALVGLGNAHQRKGAYAKAREYHLKNIGLCEQVNDREGIASSFNNLGNICNDLGDYSGAVEYYTKGAAIYELLGLERSVGVCMANIGMIQNRIRNFDLAIEYFDKCNVIFKKLNYKPGTYFALKNKGVSLKNKGEFDKALASYRSALRYYEEIGALYLQAEIHENIGNIHWEKRLYDSALHEYLSSLEIAQRIDDSLALGRVNNFIGTVYAEKKNYTIAKKYLEASQIARNLHNPLILLDATQGLTGTYAELREFEDAYENLSLFNVIKDSLQGVEKDKVTREIEAKYQNEKKAKEIELLSAQNETKTLQIRKRENERIYLLALIIISSGLGAVMYLLYKVRGKANDKLSEINRLQSSFFANISHEFRTPLTLILASLHENEDQSGKSAIIERNASRLLQLINQLLDLSKLEAGSEKLRVRLTSISDFLNALTAAFSPLAEDRNINFTIDITASKVQGYLDTDKLEKIVYNLLSNAFKFTPPHGVVTFRASVAQATLTFEVSDTGTGIPAHAVRHIFDRFYQIENTDVRSYEGTGIGLTLTKELVELHRGTISVISSEGTGSCFSVTIPLTGYRTEEISLDSDNDIESKYPEIVLPFPVNRRDDDGAFIPELNDCSTTGEFVVLVVEDNSDLLTYISENIGSNYKVLQARNGQQGYEEALNHIPDIIISDLMMPLLDGRSMCVKIRGNEKLSHIPVIMLTAKADRESKLAGLGTGADDYLIKPFDIKELQLKIQNILLRQDRLRNYIKSQFIIPESRAVNASERFVKKASDVVHANLSNPEFSIDDFSSAMGFSRMQLHRKLKAITGYSANEFVRMIRLKQAATLLEKGYDHVAQIAYETGFSSPSYFTKCFRETYGVIPTDYAESRKSRA